MLYKNYKNIYFLLSFLQYRPGLHVQKQQATFFYIFHLDDLE